MTIPVTLTAGTAEAGDYGTLTSITIPAGSTSATGTISTTADADADDETFKVVLGTADGAVLWDGLPPLTVTISEPQVQQQVLQQSSSEDTQPQLQQRAAPLTAAFERVPSGHDGDESFRFNVRFSEALGAEGVAPVAASFAVRGGRVKRVRQLQADLWRVRITPDSWRDVRVTLGGRSRLRHEGRGVRGGRPGALERHERDGGRPGAHLAEGRQGARGPGRGNRLRGEFEPRGGACGVGGLRDRRRHGGGGR